MKLFDFLKSKSNNGQYVTEKGFNNNRDKHMEMVPEIFEQLRKLNVTEDKELNLEYFFYTNTSEKAEQFANEIRKLNYTVEHGVSAGNKRLFIITGRTTKIRMTDEIVIEWTKQMCELGYKYDCEFDGWGTEPDQE